MPHKAVVNTEGFTHTIRPATPSRTPFEVPPGQAVTSATLGRWGSGHPV